MFGLCLIGLQSPGLLSVNLVVPEMLISFGRQIPYILNLKLLSLLKTFFNKSYIPSNKINLS